MINRAARYQSFDREMKQKFGERVFRVTRSAEREGKIFLKSLASYATECVDFLENLRPDITIQRLNAHGPRTMTVAPEWSVNKMATMNAIHQELEKRDTWQGKKLGASLDDLL